MNDVCNEMKWQGTLKDLAEIIGVALMRGDVPPAQAASLSVSAVILIAECLGAQRLYIPRVAVRDRKIWEQWRGDNIAELTRRYDLSRSQIHRIIAGQRELQRRAL